MVIAANPLQAGYVDIPGRAARRPDVGDFVLPPVNCEPLKERSSFFAPTRCTQCSRHPAYGGHIFWMAYQLSLQIAYGVCILVICY
jgi:hypothetical protein